MNFYQMSVGKERNDAIIRVLRKALEERRRFLRKACLLQYLSAALQNCTQMRAYSVGNWKWRKIRRAKAWHSEKCNPLMPSISGRNFSEIVLGLKEDVSAVAITIEKANVCYPRRRKAVIVPLTRFIHLGNIVFNIPDTQKGKGELQIGVSGISRRATKEILIDLVVKTLLISWPEEAGDNILEANKHDIKLVGKYFLV